MVYNLLLCSIVVPFPRRLHQIRRLWKNFSTDLQSQMLLLLNVNNNDISYDIRYNIIYKGPRRFRLLHGFPPNRTLRSRSG